MMEDLFSLFEKPKNPLALCWGRVVAPSLSAQRRRAVFLHRDGAGGFFGRTTGKPMALSQNDGRLEEEGRRFESSLAAQRK